MPAPELIGRHQRAVLWEADGFDAYGQPRVSDEAVELTVRWDDRQSEAIDPLGNTIAIDATAVVDRRVPVGSVMRLGALEDLPPGTSFTDEESGLMTVATYSETPDIKNRVAYRTVGLRRLKDTLPEYA